MLANSFKSFLSLIIVILVALGAIGNRAIPARAVTAEEIRSLIKDHNEEIGKLEIQIDAFQAELGRINQTSKNLRGEIARLETTRKKLAANIKVTEQKIAKTDLTIEQLGLKISAERQTLERRRRAVGESLRQWRKLQERSFVEIMLGYAYLSDAWSEITALAAFQRNLDQDIDAVSRLKGKLEATRRSSEDERARLDQLKDRLADERQIAQNNQNEKDRLLKQTKNQEANYQKLLTETIARKEAFEKELFELESRLRIVIDPSKLPPAGRGVLGWPLENIFITQQFGKTVDAKRLYASGTHNGIDLRAGPGTPVLAAGAGVVRGTGDTDPVCRGASYGKWVLLEHPNGLSTIYGHLSLIKAQVNETVGPGTIIAYSGQTGYSTGPHLHLSVVATEGVRLTDYNFRSCAGAKITMPLADPRAYLDPLLYL